MLPSPTDSVGNQRPVRHLFITVVKFNFPYPLMGANWRGELFTIKGIFGFDMWNFGFR